MGTVRALRASDSVSHGSGSTVQLHSPVVTYLNTVAEATRPDIRRRLDRCAGLLATGADALELDWTGVGPFEVAALRERLEGEGLSWGTVANHLMAVRGVVRTSWLLGLVSRDHFERVKAVPVPRGRALQTGRYVSADEWEMFFASLGQDTTPIGRRDCALFSVLLGGGLRRASVLAVRVEDLDLGRLVCKVNTAKGNRAYEVELPEFCREPLRRWLKVRGTATGPLFVVVRHHGRVDRNLKGLTPTGLHYALKERVKAAGIPTVCLHDFRRACATGLLEQGVDLAMVARHLNHTNVRVTAMYDKRGRDQLRRAVNALPSPFGGGA